MKRWTSAVLLLLLACPWGTPLSAQDSNDTSDYAQGKALLSRISKSRSDAAADQGIFRQIGIERSQKILLALVTHGMSPSATLDDWAAMHRAYDALIELCIGESQFLKGSIYGNLQDFAYSHNEGDYAAAATAAREALDLQQRSGEKKTLSIPWANLGQELIHVGKLDEGANALYEARKVLDDPTSTLAADIWSKIVAVEESRGHNDVAHAESQAFLDSAGPQTPARYRASALLAAANLDIDEQHYDQAIERVHLAMHGLKGEKDTSTAAYQAVGVLLNIGVQAMASMPYDQALNLCVRIDKNFPGLPISLTSFTYNVANHRRRLAGQFDQVLHDDAANLRLARDDNNISGQISSLLSTSIDYSYMGEKAQQVAALQQAVDLLHANSADKVSPLLRFSILNELGYAQFTRGDLRASRAAYTEALNGMESESSAQTRGELGANYADAQLGIAALLQKDGDYKRAREILEQALNPKPGSLGRFTHSEVLLDLARLEQSAPTAKSPAEQQEQVTRLYLDAIAALHTEKDMNREVDARLKLVQYLANIPTTQDANRGPGAAKPAASAMASAREQLAVARVASASVGLADADWRVKFLKGVLDQNAGSRAAAIQSYEAAVNALDHIRAGLSEEEERSSFVDSGAVQELYSRLVQLLTESGDREHAWEYLERNKARSFLESLHGRRFAAPSSVDPYAKTPATDVQQLEQQIISTRLALSPDNEAALRDSGRSADVLRVKLAALENEFTLARQQTTLSASRATQPIALAPITLAATQRTLPPHTALLEYALLDKEIAAFVVTHGSVVELHWAADAAALATTLRRLNKQLAKVPAAGDDLESDLASVSDVLLAPVVRAIAPDIDRLIIVPTQSLALIPFEVLPLPTSGSSATPIKRSFSAAPSHRTSAPRPLLIDRFSIAYLPSASTLQFLHFGTPSSSPDLFLGAIGEISSENLPPLPGTLQETAAIQRLYPHAVRVAGPQFTHDAAVSALLEHDEVHFATHGLFDAQAPLFSALVTAPASGQSSRLALYELMDLNLKARLVILSACETDRGQMTGGDEASGLTRTFLQAGAENVVSSLWKVSDESTALLMESLHAHLRAGELTPDALRHAQLEARRKYPQPFYWAAFVDTGVR